MQNFSKDTEQIKLNSREMEFLKLAGTELTYKEIADQMCISARTVDGYRDQLFEKLRIKSRVGLVLYAIKNNRIELYFAKIISKFVLCHTKKTPSFLRDAAHR